MTGPNCIDCDILKTIENTYPVTTGDYLFSRCKECYSQYRKNIYSGNKKRKRKLEGVSNNLAILKKITHEMQIQFNLKCSCLVIDRNSQVFKARLRRSPIWDFTVFTENELLGGRVRPEDIEFRLIFSDHRVKKVLPPILFELKSRDMDLFLQEEVS